MVMLSGGLGFHALLEAKGGRVVGLAVIFVGIVPIMIVPVLSASNDRLIPAAAWSFGISPATAPVHASATLLSINELPASRPRGAEGVLFLAGRLGAGHALADHPAACRAEGDRRSAVIREP